jgi:hypothetical protein
LQRQKFHPPDGVFVVSALVVALDGNAGDAGVAQPAQHTHRLVERQCVDRALVKEVAGQDDEVHRPADLLVEGEGALVRTRLILAGRFVDDGVERGGEIVEARRLTVLQIAKMDVGAMQEACLHKVA